MFVGPFYRFMVDLEKDKDKSKINPEFGLLREVAGLYQDDRVLLDASKRMYKTLANEELSKRHVFFVALYCFLT